MFGAVILYSILGSNDITPKACEHIFEVEKDSCSGGEAATGFLRMDDVFFDG